eukprot:gene15512-5460_t
MAKVGEGDSRWIVSERADGRNCGSWHWAERDVTGWAHAALRDELQGKEVGTVGGVAVRTAADASVTGDATVMGRRGKAIHAYDLALEVGWEADVDGAAAAWRGKFACPDVDHTTPAGEVRVDVVCPAPAGGAGGEAAARAAAVARAEGPGFVRGAVSRFAGRLRDAHATPNQRS